MKRLLKFILSIFLISLFWVTFFVCNENVELICNNGKSTGAAAQKVCIKQDYVMKSSRHCKTTDFKCKWTMIKQRYTYKNWEDIYNGLEIISNVSRLDADHIIMTLESHHKHVKPNKTKNWHLLSELQERLVRNDQLLLDAYPGSNAFLDRNGCIKLIDFTLVPKYLKVLPIGIDFLEEFPNIAAGDNERFRQWYDQSKI
jgi:hypothetical protein